MTTLSQSELSYDIIFEEILTRLPVKSVVRFKSVSKKWYSTLSSSDFATAHFTKSPFSRPCAPIHTLFIGSSTHHFNSTYYLLPFDDSNRISGDFEKGLVKLDVDFGDDNNGLRVVGSCNGLICLAPYSIGCTYFFLWNPATRKLNKYDGFIVSTPDLVHHLAFGFGYVSAVDDYKFVRITSKRQTDGPHPSIVHVFSCRRNKWTQLDFDFDLSAYLLGYRATLVNEKLYWPRWSTSAGTIGAIISFDLGAEKFDIFHYPDSEACHLGIMGERLCKVGLDGMIDILMPPTILKSITLPKDLHFACDPYGHEIVGFTRDGELLVLGEFNTAGTVLYLVNIDTEPLECSKLMELEGMFMQELKEIHSKPVGLMQKLAQFPLPTHDVVYRGVTPNEFHRSSVTYSGGQNPQLQEKLLLGDAISDLPAVDNYETRDEIPYVDPPATEFQRFIRLTKDAMLGSGNEQLKTVYDHRPLRLNIDDYHRVCRVPKKKGANFRDFPGVRLTADKKKVEWDPTVDREYLPSGKPLVPDYAMSFVKGTSTKPFGRKWFDETVPTVVTRAEPHNQAVCHPFQDRVLTIRENARLQGFPDYYKLTGPVKQRFVFLHSFYQLYPSISPKELSNIRKQSKKLKSLTITVMNWYMQVGNAVAVPVARALGFALALASDGHINDDPVFTLPAGFPVLHPAIPQPAAAPVGGIGEIEDNPNI